MDLIAYALREEYAGTVEQETDEGIVTVPVYTGGVIVVGDRDLNVREALDEGDGTIIIEERNVAAAAALDGYLPLKRVTAPAGAEPTLTLGDSYEDVTVAELRADASSRGLLNVSKASKDELVDALTEHDRLLAEDALDRLGAPLTIDRLAASGRGEDVAPAPAPASPEPTPEPEPEPEPDDDDDHDLGDDDVAGTEER